MVYSCIVMEKQAWSFLCRDCLCFCFMDLIQEELDEIKKLWNTHLICHAKFKHQINGVPNELFYIPEVRGK